MRLHVQHRQHRPVFRGARGYAMAALLVSIAVMGILMSAAMPVWRQAARREKDPMTEDGEFQVLYQASLAASAPGGGSAPSTLSGPGSQTGLSAPTRSIGRRGGVIGVVSKSEEASIRLYNDRDHYNEWLFVYIATTTQVGGAPGVQQGAGRGQQGRPQSGQLGSGQRDGGGGRGGRGSLGRQGQRPGQPGAAGRPPGGRPSLAPPPSRRRPPG